MLSTKDPLSRGVARRGRDGLPAAGRVVFFGDSAGSGASASHAFPNRSLGMKNLRVHLDSSFASLSQNDKNLHSHSFGARSFLLRCQPEGKISQHAKSKYAHNYWNENCQYAHNNRCNVLNGCNDPVSQAGSKCC